MLQRPTLTTKTNFIVTQPGAFRLALRQTSVSLAIPTTIVIDEADLQIGQHLETFDELFKQL